MDIRQVAIDHTLIPIDISIYGIQLNPDMKIRDLILIPGFEIADNNRQLAMGDFY